MIYSFIQTTAIQMQVLSHALVNENSSKLFRFMNQGFCIVKESFSDTLSGNM